MANEVKLTVNDIVRECHGRLVSGDVNIVLGNFVRDTRKVSDGDVYVGIKGEHYDGNIFFEEALMNGASVCILQNIDIKENVIQKYKDRAIIIVQDTIRALQQLAAYKRSLYNIPVVAITGSVGKTSTKDIVSSVMSKKYNVLKTEGNLNSQLGTALTVLRLKDHDAMVVELGMSQFGEISRLTNIVKPTVAVITNVGTAHIGILGSRENILKAKLEILEGLQAGGKVIINNDNDLLNDWNKNNCEYKVTTYGMENKSDVMAYNITLEENGSSYDVRINGKDYHVHINVGGNHFVLNSLCAIAVGNYFDIDMESILEGIDKFELTKRRMEQRKLSDGTIIINDCYNANYDSMKAAIEYLAKLNNKLKIAVLGDMLELGSYSEELHKKVGSDVAKNKIDVLITVGNEAKNIATEACKNGVNKDKIYTFDTNIEAINKLKEFLGKNSVVLIKASNGMKFQEIAEAF